MKTSSKQHGSVSLDPAKMDIRDLVEGYYMLLAGCTLLRQDFGIVAMTNSLLKDSLSESELKSFANQFDIVHKTLSTFASGLKNYIDSKNVKESTPGYSC